jgi:hypothetical protein
MLAVPLLRDPTRLHDRLKAFGAYEHTGQSRPEWLIAREYRADFSIPPTDFHTMRMSSTVRLSIRTAMSGHGHSDFHGDSRFAIERKGDGDADISGRHTVEFRFGLFLIIPVIDHVVAVIDERIREQPLSSEKFDRQMPPSPRPNYPFPS